MANVDGDKGQRQKSALKSGRALAVEFAGIKFAIGLTWMALSSRGKLHKQAASYMAEAAENKSNPEAFTYGILKRSEAGGGTADENDRAGGGFLARARKRLTAPSSSGGEVMLGLAKADDMVGIPSAAAVIADIEPYAMVVEPISGGRFWFTSIRNGNIVPGEDRIFENKEQMREYVAPAISEMIEDPDFYQDVSIIIPADLAAELGAQSYYGDGLDLFLDGVRIRGKNRVRKLTGISFWPIALSVLAVVAIAGFLGYGQWEKSNQEQQHINSLSESAPNSADTELGNITPNLKNGKANQAQLLYYAKQQEIGWLTKKLNAVDPARKMANIAAAVETYPMFVAGWRLKTASYSRSLPDGLVMQYVSAVPGATPNDLKSSFPKSSISFGPKAVIANLSVTLPGTGKRHIKNALKYVEAQNFSRTDFISQLRSNGIQWSMSKIKNRRRRHPIAGIKNRGLAETKQLKMDDYKFTIDASGEMEAGVVLKMLRKHGNMTLSDLTVNPGKQDWEITGELYEK